MDISPLMLHLSGIKVGKDLENLSSNEDRIIETLYKVDFKNYEDLHEASQELRDIDRSEVVKCILNHWRPEYYLCGMKNIEKVFWTKIPLGEVIARYFGDDERWRFDKNSSKWLTKFNLLSRLGITVDDVTRNIDLDYLIDSHANGPGLDGFLDFILKNHGNPKILVQRIASEVERLPNADIEDIVCFMEPYIDDGDIDARKIFACVDWDYVKKWNVIRTYRDFFNHHAPELVPQIP